MGIKENTMNNYKKMKVEELRKAIDNYTEQKKDLTKDLEKLERECTSIEIKMDGLEKMIGTIDSFITALEERIEKYEN